MLCRLVKADDIPTNMMSRWGIQRFSDDGTVRSAHYRPMPSFEI